MRMRFRTDGWHYADMKAHGWAFDGDGEKSYGKCFSDPAELEEARIEWEKIPAAESGDVWRIHWGGIGNEEKIAGYAICCPGCGHVHAWCTATNCSAPRRTYTWKNGDGIEHEGSVCIHSGERSCWDWSGSAENGTLTASPSLLVQQDDCHWHGWIQNGDIHV